jgi:hypothetical protein
MIRIPWKFRLRRGMTLIVMTVATVLAIATGCTDNPPYRKLSLELLPVTADCGSQYELARWDDARGYRNPDVETDRVRRVIQADLESARKQHRPSPCWSNSVELHPATPHGVLHRGHLDLGS